MKVPTIEQAIKYIEFAEERNSGEWIPHSYIQSVCCTMIVNKFIHHEKNKDIKFTDTNLVQIIR